MGNEIATGELPPLGSITGSYGGDVAFITALVIVVVALVILMWIKCKTDKVSEYSKRKCAENATKEERSLLFDRARVWFKKMKRIPYQNTQMALNEGTIVKVVSHDLRIFKSSITDGFYVEQTFPGYTESTYVLNMKEAMEEVTKIIGKPEQKASKICDSDSDCFDDIDEVLFDSFEHDGHLWELKRYYLDGCEYGSIGIFEISTKKFITGDSGPMAIMREKFDKARLRST